MEARRPNWVLLLPFDLRSFACSFFILRFGAAGVAWWQSREDTACCYFRREIHISRGQQRTQSHIRSMRTWGFTVMLCGFAVQLQRRILNGLGSRIEALLHEVTEPKRQVIFWGLKKATQPAAGLLEGLVFIPKGDEWWVMTRWCFGPWNQRKTNLWMSKMTAGSSKILSPSLETSKNF